MAERDSYEPGTPSWVDLGVPDVDAAASFYAGLFGWNIPEPPPDGGGYRICFLRDRPVAGLGPQGDGGGDTWWTTYVTVADVDATAAEVKAAGGTITVEPNDLPGTGRMAICADPHGAPFTIWASQGVAGAEIVNEPNSWCWNERETKHLKDITDFYGQVFGWKAESFQGSDNDFGFVLGEGPVASARGITEGTETWAVYFQVDDCDAAVAKVGELGGKALGDPFEVPEIGRMCEVADPFGASFYVLSAPG